MVKKRKKKKLSPKSGERLIDILLGFPPGHDMTDPSRVRVLRDGTLVRNRTILFVPVELPVSSSQKTKKDTLCYKGKENGFIFLLK